MYAPTTTELDTLLSSLATRHVDPATPDPVRLTETELRTIAAACARGPALRNYGRGIDVSATSRLLDEVHEIIDDLTRADTTRPSLLTALDGLEHHFRTRTPVSATIELHQLYRTELEILRARFGRSDVEHTGGGVMALWAPQRRDREVLASNATDQPGVANASTTAVGNWYIGIYTVKDAVLLGEAEAADFAHAIDLAEISAARDDLITKF